MLKDNTRETRISYNIYFLAFTTPGLLKVWEFES